TFLTPKTTKGHEDTKRYKRKQTAEGTHDPGHWIGELVPSARPALAGTTGPAFRGPHADLHRDAVGDRGLRRAALGAWGRQGRARRLPRAQPADVLLRHVRRGAARGDLRAAQFPPDRSGTRVHDRRLRGERADRRRPAPPGDRAA